MRTATIELEGEHMYHNIENDESTKGNRMVNDCRSI